MNKFISEYTIFIFKSICFLLVIPKYIQVLRIQHRLKIYVLIQPRGIVVKYLMSEGHRLVQLL